MSLDDYLEGYHKSGLGVSFAALRSVDSTNRLARDVAEHYRREERPPPQLLLVAAEQTAGRGRLGRAWSSPPGRGVYASLLTAVAGADELAALPLRVPLALCAVLEPLLPSPCRIKWPNDLMVGKRKLGGVLIESVAGPAAVVIGFGINHSQSADQLPSPEATSILRAGGEPPAVEALAIELARALVAELAPARGLAETVERYRRLLVHTPGETLECRIGAETVTGVFAGIDDRGRLRLRTAAAERLLAAGEIVEAGAAEGEAGR